MSQGESSKQKSRTEPNPTEPNQSARVSSGAATSAAPKNTKHSDTHTHDVMAHRVTPHERPKTTHRSGAPTCRRRSLCPSRETSLPARCMHRPHRAASRNTLPPPPSTHRQPYPLPRGSPYLLLRLRESFASLGPTQARSSSRFVFVDRDSRRLAPPSSPTRQTPPLPMRQDQGNPSRAHRALKPRQPRRRAGGGSC